MTNTELKNNIDAAITNKTSVSSITPTNVGEQIKSTVDYIDQEISNIELIPGPQGVQGPQGPIGLTGTQGPAGPQGIAGPVGPAGLEWRGAWVSGTSYIVDDAVGFNGASWFCVNATSGTTSPNLDPTNWALLAAQGSQGPQGPQGIQGTPGNGGVINTYEDVYSSTNSAPFPTSSKTIWRFNSAGFTYALPLDVELGAVIYINSYVNCVLYNSPNPGNQGGILRTIINSAGNGDAFKNLQSGKIYRCTFLGNFGSSYGYWNIEIINNI